MKRPNRKGKRETKQHPLFETIGRHQFRYRRTLPEQRGIKTHQKFAKSSRKEEGQTKKMDRLPEQPMRKMTRKKMLTIDGGNLHQPEDEGKS